MIMCCYACAYQNLIKNSLTISTDRVKDTTMYYALIIITQGFRNFVGKVTFQGIWHRDFSGGTQGNFTPLESFCPPEVSLNDEIALDQQKHSTISWNTGRSMFLKILICPCWIYFLEKYLHEIYEIVDLSFLECMLLMVYNVCHVLGGGSELPMHYPQWKRISVDVPLVNTLLSSLQKLTDGMLDGRLHNVSMQWSILWLLWLRITIIKLKETKE